MHQTSKNRGRCRREKAFLLIVLEWQTCAALSPMEMMDIFMTVSRSEDEDDDGHYLHPSLLAGKKENVPKFTLPSINFRRSQDDSYSVLVRNLQQQLAEEKLAKESAKENESVPETQQCLVNYSMEESYGTNSANNSFGVSVIPPTEIQPIIQKMAEYVAKNGEDFEYVVKSKNDTRFEFLQPSSEYYSYYIHLRDQAKQQIQAASASVVEESAPSSENPSFPSDSTSEQQTNHSPLPSSQESELQPQRESAAYPTVDEFDALYAQDSQDLVFGPELQGSEAPAEEFSNSADSVDSIGIPKDSKAKASKIIKGPISFSLKAKDTDSIPSEKLKIPLLLDDSDEDSNGEASAEKEEKRKKRRKSTEEVRSAPSSRHDSVEREEKPKLTSEMEAKLAEERMKDKLLAAARERLVQQKKEKRLEMERQKREEQLKKEKQLQIEQQRKERQLQLERKKKAALFLKMLKSRDPDLDTSKIGIDKKSKSDKSKSSFWNVSDAEGDVTSENGVLFPLSKMRNLSGNNLPVSIPGIKSEWSESSASEESGEEIMITEFCSNPDPPPGPTSEQPVPVPEKVPEPELRHEHKKKRKKHSRSKSQERHYKSSRSRDRRRSRSPKNYKHERSKKVKELPAAYALVKRSRSRSRSPRRYRQNPGYWNRRR